jgi:hypothetical protein
LVTALKWPLARIISRVANLKKDETAMYSLVRTESQLVALVPDLTTYFEDIFAESAQVTAIRTLTYVQVP